MTTRTFSSEQLEALKVEFDVIDQNSDGQITADEVEALLRRESYAHLGDEERRRILDSFSTADTDGNGSVDFPEFVAMMARQQDPRAAFREGFDALDLDRDGLLTAADFERVSSLEGAQISREQAEEMIKLADKNQDGVVTFDEYYAVITAGSSS